MNSPSALSKLAISCTSDSFILLLLHICTNMQIIFSNCIQSRCERRSNLFVFSGVLKQIAIRIQYTKCPTIMCSIWLHNPIAHLSHLSSFAGAIICFSMDISKKRYVSIFHPYIQIELAKKENAIENKTSESICTL